MKIMVCIDFSDLTEKVIAKATELAKKTGGFVHLVHANNDLSTKSQHVSTSEIESYKTGEMFTLNDKLEKAENILKKAEVPSTSHLLLGDVSKELVKEAKKVEAEMIIIGSKTTSAVQHLVGGSLGAELLKETALPLLLIPADK